MFDGSRRSLIMSFVFGGAVILVPLSFTIYRLYKNQLDIQKYMQLIVVDREKFILETKAEKENSVEVVDVDIETRAKTWLDVQKKVKDTVVQVFSQVSKFDWLEPYRTPDQEEGRGSGFFINNNGDIVTNYHVVAQASSIEIQIPSFGREKFDAEIIGVCPDKDVALLCLTDESLKKVKEILGEISYLSFGNSDSIERTQEILALGFPLGQERLKSTLGVVSGRESCGFIQITAPINPGNSGGPSLNSAGLVIGINAAAVLEAQNVGYIIPINDLKAALKDLYKVKLLRRPTLGCIFTVANADMVKYLGNPDGGGWYIAEVFKNTILDNVGIKEGDMLYEVNGYKLDFYGEITVPWCEDKRSLLDFLNRYAIGDDIHFVVYRRGERLDFRFKLEDSYLPAVHKFYPEFETLDYEVIGGMVVMPLTLNHAAMLASRSTDLLKYAKPESQHKPALLITHIFPDSQAKKARVLGVGSTIEKVNDEEVKTLDEFREAVRKSKTGGFLTIDTYDKMFAALSVDSIIKDEDKLSARYFYKKSDLIKELAEG